MIRVDSVLIRNNDTKELNILVKTLLELAITDIIALGINPLILETFRSQIRQNYLYCQGRTIEAVTKKGISSTFAKTYCNPDAKKVTWTLNSIHLLRKAVDIVPQRKVNGKWSAIWDTKDEQTQIIISSMQKYGFEAGANWINNPDSPHFQINGTFSNAFQQGYSTVYVTQAIQKALNAKANTQIKVDGDWGINTTKAVNEFRKQQGYSAINGKLESVALKELFV